MGVEVIIYSPEVKHSPERPKANWIIILKSLL
jgi:hypothetical protein